MSEISTLNPRGFEPLSHDEMLEVDGGFFGVALFTAAKVAAGAWATGAVIGLVVCGAATVIHWCL